MATFRRRQPSLLCALYWLSSMVESAMGIAQCAIVMLTDGGWHFFGHEDKSIMARLRNPLFLYMTVRLLLGVGRLYVHGWKLMPARLNRAKADAFVVEYLDGRRSNFYLLLRVCNVCLVGMIAWSSMVILPVLFRQVWVAPQTPGSLEISARGLYAFRSNLIVTVLEVASCLIWTVVLLARIVAGCLERVDGRTLTYSWFYLAWSGSARRAKALHVSADTVPPRQQSCGELQQATPLTMSGDAAKAD